MLSDTDYDRREMLFRLQNGTTLVKAQRRANAMSGKMRDVIKDLAEHRLLREL